MALIPYATQAIADASLRVFSAQALVAEPVALLHASVMQDLFRRHELWIHGVIPDSRGEYAQVGPRARVVNGSKLQVDSATTAIDSPRSLSVSSSGTATGGRMHLCRLVGLRRVVKVFVTGLVIAIVDTIAHLVAALTGDVIAAQWSRLGDTWSLAPTLTGPHWFPHDRFGAACVALLPQLPGSATPNKYADRDARGGLNNQ